MTPSPESVSAGDVPLSHPVTTFPTASAAVKQLEDFGMVAEVTGQRNNRVDSHRAHV